MEYPDNHHRDMEAMFGSFASRYDEVVPFFATLANGLVNSMARLIEGREVDLFLDIGSGRSALAQAAISQLHAERVVAGDISSAMLALATKSELGTPINLVQCDGEMLPVRSSCAAAAGCSVSFRFFAAPRIALEEMHRTLRAGGVLGICELGRTDPKWAFFYDMLRRYERKKFHSVVRASVGGRRDGIEDLMKDVGFIEIGVTEQQMVFKFRDEQHWWDWTNSCQWGYSIRQLGEYADEFRMRALEIVRQIHPLELQQTARFVTAQCLKMR